jgi:hypothetical protein
MRRLIKIFRHELKKIDIAPLYSGVVGEAYQREDSDDDLCDAIEELQASGSLSSEPASILPASPEFCFLI